MVSSTQRLGLRVVWTGTKEHYYSMPENPRPHDYKCLNDSYNVEWRRSYGYGSQSSCSRHLFEFTFMLFFVAITYHTWLIILCYLCVIFWSCILVAFVSSNLINSTILLQYYYWVVIATRYITACVTNAAISNLILVIKAAKSKLGQLYMWIIVNILKSTKTLKKNTVKS